VNKALSVMERKMVVVRCGDRPVHWSLTGVPLRRGYTRKVQAARSDVVEPAIQPALAQQLEDGKEYGE
jgi:hypothetical protein